MWKKIEELMGLVKRNNPSLTEAYFVSSFVSGLKDYIQHHLKCYKPPTLSQTFWYAKRLEQASPIPKKTTYVVPTQRPHQPWVKDSKEKDQQTNNIAESRAAGKCFKCREPWAPGHAKVCKGKQIYSVLVVENANGQEEISVVENSTLSENEEFHDAEAVPVHNLSLHALTGTSTTATTFTLKIHIGKQIATTLVDTGSDLSFIQAKFAIKSNC